MSDADHRNPQQPYPDQGWQPLPQGGEYESEATAFVQLPEGFTTGAYGAGTSGYGTPGADPLAAPGHGYTPPASFTRYASTPPIPGAGTDPSATGQWTMPFADSSAGYADPSAGYAPQQAHDTHQGPAADPAGYQGAPEAAQPWGDRVEWPVAGGAEAAGGPWSVPAADDGQEESGEYLVGDESLTGHGGLPGHGGYSGHPGHPGVAGPGAGGYQDGGYPGGYGAGEGAADTNGTGRTGHWNFATGLTATSGTAGDGYGAAEDHGDARDTTHGGTANDPFGGPVDDPYARHGGQSGHENGTSGDLRGGDPYGAGAGGSANGAGGATGHWSLPADALAQWPPATETPQHGTPHDGTSHDQGHAHEPHAHEPHPHDPHAHGAEQAPGADAGSAAPGTGHGADRWTVPAAPGEQPDESGAFALAAGDSNGAGTAYGAQETYDGSPATDGETVAHAEAPVADAQAHAAETGAQQEPAARPEAETPAPAPEEPAPAAGTGDPAPEGTADAPAPDGQDAAPDAPAGPYAEAAEPVFDAYDEHPAASYVLRVNGTDRPVTDAWIGESLLYVLRERLGLAGAKDGCSQGECGACSVQVDGRLVASCLVPAATAAGSEVRTVEGLAQDGAASDVQRALAASGAVQCGFCVPGMAMTVHDLLEGNHAPTELETRKALCGNLCRCSGYRGVLDAVDDVVKARAEAADAAASGPADTVLIPHQAGPADPTGPAPHDQDSGHHPHDPLTHGAHHEGPGADPQTGGPA
ncbi:2Fe-2S iron-sulfur cluster-binding protein [Streptomyces sp. NPDC017993]|uniref:2Fe-2S iron-sulfur cluster-binding protein n=1 Tax=Streptomyces sp. NPDC017993 TaxID=3365027 RepID=UPI0037A8E2E3